MIKDNTGRPIYFSRTSGGYGSQEFGLGPYLVTQGLARKLVPDIPRAASRDTMLIPGEGFVDVTRSTVLWDSVFQAPKSIVKKGDWPDRASVGIPGALRVHGIHAFGGATTLGQQRPRRIASSRPLRELRGQRGSVTCSTRCSQLPPLGAEGDTRSAPIPLPVRPESGKKQ